MGSVGEGRPGELWARSQEAPVLLQGWAVPGQGRRPQKEQGAERRNSLGPGGLGRGGGSGRRHSFLRPGEGDAVS